MKLEAGLRSRSKLKAALIATLVGTLVGVVPLVAQASTVYSSWGSISGGYQNRAGAAYSSGYAQANTYIENIYASPLPAGTIGAKGRLFLSNGALSCEGGIWWNPNQAWNVTGYSCGQYAYGVTYYSYGVTWRGSSAYYTYSTSNFTT